MQLPVQQDFPIIQEILNERDRGAAIVGAGFLDGKLTETIKTCFRADDKTAERLLKPTGPLGAFGNKALLGYMLKLYREETLKDFELVGQIRNRFAHVAEPMTFGSDFVRQRCEQLTLVRRVWSIIPEFPFSKRPFDAAAARKEYLEVISLAANFLHHQAQHAHFRERAEELLPF